MRLLFLLLFQVFAMVSWAQLQVSSQVPADPYSLDEYTYFLDDDLIIRVHAFEVNVYQADQVYNIDLLQVVNDTTVHVYKDRETLWYEITVDEEGELNQINVPTEKPKTVKDNGLALVEGAIRTQRCWQEQDWIMQFQQDGNEYKLRIRDGAIAVKKDDEYLPAFSVTESNGWIIVEDPISESELLRIPDPEQSLPGGSKDFEYFNLWLRFPDGLIYTEIKGKERVWDNGDRVKKKNIEKSGKEARIDLEDKTYSITFDHKTGKLSYSVAEKDPE